LKELADIRLSGFKTLSETMLYKISTVAPKLEVVDINGYVNLSESIFSIFLKE